MNSNIEDVKIEGFSNKISSKEIISFSYQHHTYYYEAKKVRGELHIVVSGGNLYERDETGFRISYITKDLSLMSKLQKVIEKYRISFDNGHVYDDSNAINKRYDTISVMYKSKEEIYKSSNQFQILPNRACDEIYELFHEDALNNHLDFTAKSSNAKIYDDATEEFLQGRWIGDHNGKHYMIDFIGDVIKVYVDKQIMDDTNYIIIRGCIRKSRKKVAVASSEYDFEQFNSLSSIRKKNNNTLIVYFSDLNNEKMELIKEQN